MWFRRIFLTLALLVAACGYYLYTDYQNFLDAPLEIAGDTQILAVAPGMGIKDITQALYQPSGLSLPAIYLQAYTRLNHLAHRLKAGEYRITSKYTPRRLIADIVAARVIQYSLTVIEGWTFRQLRRALANHPDIVQTLDGIGNAELMSRLGQAGKHPEGRFFPDTYHFPKGTTDLAFLRRAMAAMDQRLKAVWAQRAPKLPLENPYQALILASIIEKETSLPAEQPQVAGVFIRRLRKGMRLQTDPTVIYGLGEEFDGNIRRRDLRTDTPYNTYTNKGLPPTPIALPGAGALAAAVNPAHGDALYFVATGDGGHVFSKTLSEHNRAVRRYQLRKH
ncbi:MAG: aminodeoxychorismate lyase [Candidatus Contendobacter odensis]|uniref:Endolytic murein transglycosylase n=1 Tax=Candidatus Contendibacter odensensis TaxID=1400860 RepID=A0A2G6PGG0_9GAMM|nr:MAG: aminodeoxychorismate lyase [Candidatus Contendobacter odensis]